MSLCDWVYNEPMNLWTGSTYTQFPLLVYRKDPLPVSGSTDVVYTGLLSDLWNDLHAEIAQALRTRTPSPATVRAIHGRSQEVLAQAGRALPVLARRKAQHGASADFPG